jgi:hypothetical protein
VSGLGFTNLHSWKADTSSLELGDGCQSTRASIFLLTTEEVEVEAATQSAVSDGVLPKQPFLAVSWSESISGHCICPSSAYRCEHTCREQWSRNRSVRSGFLDRRELLHIHCGRQYYQRPQRRTFGCGSCPNGSREHSLQDRRRCNPVIKLLITSCF